MESPYATELKSCKQSWGDISRREDSQKITQCYEKLLFSIRPLVKGKDIPKLSIKSLDPLVVPDTIQIGQAGGALNGNLTGMVVRGVSNVLAPGQANMTYDTQTKTVTLVVTAPKNSISLTTGYKIKLDIGAVFQQGDNNVRAGSSGSFSEGTLDATAEDLVATLTVTLRKAKSGELRVQTSKATFDASGLKMSFKGKDPNDSFTGLLNTIMSSQESADRVIEEVKPTINKILAATLGSLLHGGLKRLEEL
jgi:hypothetical protein